MKYLRRWFALRTALRRVVHGREGGAGWGWGWSWGRGRGGVGGRGGGRGGGAGRAGAGAGGPVHSALHTAKCDCSAQAEPLRI